MGIGFSSRPSSVRTTGISPRASEKEGTGRTLLVFGLCAVLPPVGLLILWRSRHTTIAMRIGASLLSVCVMTLFFSMRMEESQGGRILPSPVTPTTVGYGSVTARTYSFADVAPAPMASSYTNAAPAPAQGSGGQTTVGQENVVQETAGQTTVDTQWVGEVRPIQIETDQEQYVYTVSNNPSVFHAAQTCDGQVNRRQIMIDAALNEGLTPCEKCFPAG